MHAYVCTYDYVIVKASHCQEKANLFLHSGKQLLNPLAGGILLLGIKYLLFRTNFVSFLSFHWCFSLSFNVFDCKCQSHHSVFTVLHKQQITRIWMPMPPNRRHYRYIWFCIIVRVVADVIYRVWMQIFLHSKWNWWQLN